MHWKARYYLRKITSDNSSNWSNSTNANGCGIGEALSTSWQYVSLLAAEVADHALGQNKTIFGLVIRTGTMWTASMQVYKLLGSRISMGLTTWWISGMHASGARGSRVLAKNWLVSSWWSGGNNGNSSSKGSRCNGGRCNGGRHNGGGRDGGDCGGLCSRCNSLILLDICHPLLNDLPNGVKACRFSGGHFLSDLLIIFGHKINKCQYCFSIQEADVSIQSD